MAEKSKSLAKFLPGSFSYVAMSQARWSTQLTMMRNREDV